MLMMRRPSRWAQDEGINLTPLLDVIFNLIFFFVLATTLRQEREMLINLPRAANANEPASDEKALVVKFDADGNYYFRDEPVALEAIPQTLLDAGAAQAPGIIIYGDADASYQAALSAMDVCQEAGLLQVSLRAGQADKPVNPASTAEPPSD